MVGIVTFAAKLDERYEIGIREQFPTALKSCYFFSNYTYIYSRVQLRRAWNYNLSSLFF